MSTLSPHMTREAGFASPGPEASGYSSESSRNTTIANEKKARKAVEEDAARLHNRVTTLQKEEQKAQKRLDETRRKARDLLELRAQNERRQLEREERQQQLQAGHSASSCNHCPYIVPLTCHWPSVKLSLSAQHVCRPN